MLHDPVGEGVLEELSDWAQSEVNPVTLDCLNLYKRSLSFCALKVFLKICNAQGICHIVTPEFF